ncbi:MAG: sugar transferase [Anaerolineales bacterium]
MLRVFSTKRILFFFLFDWFGSLFVLWLAGNLRELLGTLPDFVRVLLFDLSIQVEGVRGQATLLSTIPFPVYVLVFLLWPFFFANLSVYEGRRNQTIKAELTHISFAIFVCFTILSGVLYFTYRETSRLILILFGVLDLLVLLSGRLILWLYRKTSTKGTRSLSQAVVVVGAGPVGEHVVQELRKYAWASFDIVGYLDDDQQKLGQYIENIPVLGTLDQAETIIRQHEIKHAIVALPLRAHERLVMICKNLQKIGVQVHVIPDLFILSFPNAELDGFGGIPVISLGKPGLSGWARTTKRIFDVVVSLLCLVLLSPIFLITALLICLDSPGPIFYRQQRIGEHGRLFLMLKFRSMKVNADTNIHKAYVSRLIKENIKPEQNGNGNKSLKMDNDPRITRVGHWIRKTSIDELPQLFNVLRGDMSLVGPRPPLPYEVDLYKDWHKRRMEVLPGITGLWQVKGRNRVSFDEMVRMDLEYIEHQTLWLDVQIILQTPWALVNGKGAG